jgi:HAMP domain-containing protein
MIEEMCTEVEKHDMSINVNEDLYNKLEVKVRKKFNEEVDKLEKSFRRIMDQLEIQHQNLFQMMKEQIDKEIKQLQEKKKKIKEREKMIEEQRTELKQAVTRMELYQDENKFNLFHEKKRKDLKMLQALNDFIKPSPYFVYYMFKDTIHVDDYGSIKETLFKFPSLNRGSKNQAFIYLFGDDINSKVNLCYDVNEDEWSFKKLPDNLSHKFYQCSASIALSPTEILITGGGSPPKKDARIYMTQNNEILNKA